MQLTDMTPTAGIPVTIGTFMVAHVASIYRGALHGAMNNHVTGRVEYDVEFPNTESAATFAGHVATIGWTAEIRYRDVIRSLNHPVTLSVYATP